MVKNRLLLLCLLVICLSSCRVYEAQPFEFERPVDTTTRPIELQEKKLYQINGIYADNRFDGARLNDFEHIKDEHYRATISPENKPINPSPYYAFKLWSNDNKSITLELNYTDSRHRYTPKISRNGEDWTLLPDSLFALAADSVNATLFLEIASDTLWIAAQEIQNSTHVREWCETIAQHQNATFSVIGKSKLGRDLFSIDIGNGGVRKKDVIAVISRQHPPEVTGYLAMKAFIEEIMNDTPLSKAFREKYRILVLPLMNPDGVDLGHWRHNAGGIDPNRDWAFYNQEENRIAANFFVKETTKSRSKLLLGLDFHSTYYDIFYTNKNGSAAIPNFTAYWLQGIDLAIGKESRKRPSYPSAPVSKNWFFKQFGAEAIVYEIGDDTPRDFIRQKGTISAVEMMKLLIFR